MLELLSPAARWAAVFWRLAADDAPPVETTWRGEPVTIHKGRYTRGIQEDWIPSWGLAWTLRHQDLLSALCFCGAQVPNRDNANGPAVWDYYSALLQAFHTDDPSWAACAEETAWHSEPGRVSEMERVAFQDVYAVSQLVLAFEEPKNTDRFNQALYDALLAHKQKLVDLEMTTRRDRQLAWVPMGLAAVAYDRGIPIEVESDYAPGWLIRGEQLGQG